MMLVLGELQWEIVGQCYVGEREGEEEMNVQ